MSYHRPLLAVVVAVLWVPSVAATDPVEPADEARDALVRNLRIGFVPPTGDVVWPIETTEESATRFAPPLWSEERDARRRRWAPDLSAAPPPMLEEQLRLSVGATVMVLHDGRSLEAVIDGFTILKVGCGEAETGWRARLAATSQSQGIDPATNGLRDAALWRSRYSRREPRPFPVLVSLDNAAFDPPIAAHQDDPPPGLLADLAGHDLLEHRRRLLRTGRFWTVYGARHVDLGRKIGSVRSIWQESDGGYRLMVKKATNPTFEEMITTSVVQERQAFRADSAVGQVHALFSHAGRSFFLSRYLGWESDLVFLEELRATGLEPILVDGLDRGC